MEPFIDEALRTLDTKLAAHFTDEDVERLFRISRRVAKHRLDTRSKLALSSPEHTALFLGELLKTEVNEHFGMVYLDSQNRVLSHEILFTGTIDKASVFPRPLCKAVLDNEAASVILFHNHPSGTTDASQADRQITRKIKLVLDQIDVDVLDHIILGLDGSSSFAEKGWI